MEITLVINVNTEEGKTLSGTFDLEDINDICWVGNDADDYFQSFDSDVGRFNARVEDMCELVINNHADENDEWLTYESHEYEIIDDLPDLESSIEWIIEHSN